MRLKISVEKTTADNYVVSYEGPDENGYTVQMIYNVPSLAVAMVAVEELVKLVVTRVAA